MFPLPSLQERVMLKMACEICGRTMLPCSLKVHMSTVHKNPSKAEKPITQDEIEVHSKMKRAAATKWVCEASLLLSAPQYIEFGPDEPGPLDCLPCVSKILHQMAIKSDSGTARTVISLSCNLYGIDKNVQDFSQESSWIVVSWNAKPGMGDSPILQNFVFFVTQWPCKLQFTSLSCVLNKTSSRNAKLWARGNSRGY
jgi:hypothetical protein